MSDAGHRQTQGLSGGPLFDLDPKSHERKYIAVNELTFDGMKGRDDRATRAAQPGEGLAAGAASRDAAKRARPAVTALHFT